MKCDLHKEKVVVSTLLLVKAEDIYWNATKMHKSMKTELCR